MADRSEALQVAFQQIEKAYGKGAIMKLGSRPAPDLNSISTGSIGLDIALGVGGFPRGRIIEIYGPESSGKTTLALHAIAEAQKQGGNAAFIDAEHALDPVYAQKLGVNIDNLLISQPDNAEQALEITDSLVRSGAIDIIIVDSVAALVPKAEIEGDMGDSHMGLQARLMSQALRKLTANIGRSNCVLIFINQIRMKIGVMFGSPETTTGGNALKFYSSIRLDIRRTGAIKDKENTIGNETRVKVIKNKVAPPFKIVDFDIMYGEGISTVGEIVDIGVANNIIDKAGAWFSYNDQRIGQGKENVKKFLKENPQIADEIITKIKAITNPSGVGLDVSGEAVRMNNGYDIHFAQLKKVYCGKENIPLLSRDSIDCRDIPLDKRKELLGNKGANLIEMCSLGVPVPPGFILSTELCRDENVDISSIKKKLQELEIITGRVFGSLNNPLLLSVRSGAVVSMPGMMDTVLNIGLNDNIVEGLASVTSNRIFAYDSYRRLIQMYSSVVLGVEDIYFEEIIARHDLSKVSDIENVIKQFKELVLEETGRAFPQDIYEQLITSIRAVFESWHSDRAKVYRERNGIDHNLATAATVQTMVFGNMGESSATGVLFTRNPITGEKALFGEFLTNAQGEDVVAGTTNTQPLTVLDGEKNGLVGDLSMEVLYPEIFSKLNSVAQKLESHFKDMQDIEFTVEEGNLWILQTRSGKRSSAAAMKIAIDMVSEGMKSEKEALKDIPSSAIEQSIHKQLILKEGDKPIAKGLAASPGAASGVIALTSKRAEVLSKSNQVILIRNETSPEDIAGMYSSEGIVTARGGVTSHAAVVARGIGKPCICSVENLVIMNNSSVSINGELFKEGDHITIDGSTGRVFKGHIEMTPTTISDDFIKILSLMEKGKKIDVMANAETPEDVRTAMMFGAGGIGLCRTEHMFFDKDRINDVRRMILADSHEARKDILVKLGHYQKDDFLQLLEILDGKPLCVRLLDPPLHEFLPQTDDDIKDYCEANNELFEKIQNTVKNLHEYNPMLGHRGVRLGVTYPDIYQCQVIALFEAAAQYEREFRKKAEIEIMIPLIFSENELIFMQDIIKRVKDSTVFAKNISYKFGAMIELPRIALLADKIAEYVDFVSFGTNDLTQTTFGVSRDDSSKFLSEYIRSGMIQHDPFASIDKDGVGKLMKLAIKKIKKKNPLVKVGVCGEHGGDEESIKFFYKIGCDYVSCSPYRVPVAKLAISKIN